jgi:hypothetical protein
MAKTTPKEKEQREPKKEAPKKEAKAAASKPAKAPAKAPAKKTSTKSSRKKVKEGEKYTCGVCGLVISVDEACGCVDACDIVCCGQEMEAV